VSSCTTKERSPEKLILCTEINRMVGAEPRKGSCVFKENYDVIPEAATCRSSGIRMTQGS